MIGLHSIFRKPGKLSKISPNVRSNLSKATHKASVARGSLSIFLELLDRKKLHLYYVFPLVALNLCRTIVFSRTFSIDKSSSLPALSICRQSQSAGSRYVLMLGNDVLLFGYDVT